TRANTTHRSYSFRLIAVRSIPPSVFVNGERRRGTRLSVSQGDIIFRGQHDGEFFRPAGRISGKAKRGAHSRARGPCGGAEPGGRSAAIRRAQACGAAAALGPSAGSRRCPVELGGTERTFP